MNVWTAVLASIVRFALGILVGYLIKHSLIGADLADRILTEGGQEITAAILVLGTSAWIWISHRKRVQLILAALRLPENSTVEDLKAKKDASTE